MEQKKNINEIQYLDDVCLFLAAITEREASPVVIVGKSGALSLECETWRLL